MPDTPIYDRLLREHVTYPVVGFGTCRRCERRGIPLITGLPNSDTALLAPHEDPLFAIRGAKGLAARCFGTHTVPAFAVWGECTCLEGDHVSWCPARKAAGPPADRRDR